MTKALSIINKQQISKDSKLPLKWIDLDSTDRKIVMAVCFNDSPEIARKNLKLSIHGFYARWRYLKSVYNNLLDDLPNQAINVLKASSKKAAETLAKNLDAENPSDQIKAANSVLDRVTSDKGQPTRRITLEEFLGTPTTFTQSSLPNTEPTRVDRVIEGHVQDWPVINTNHTIPDGLDEEII